MDAQQEVLQLGRCCGGMFWCWWKQLLCVRLSTQHCRRSQVWYTAPRFSSAPWDVLFDAMWKIGGLVLRTLFYILKHQAKSWHKSVEPFNHQHHPGLGSLSFPPVFILMGTSAPFKEPSGSVLDALGLTPEV